MRQKRCVEEEGRSSELTRPPLLLVASFFLSKVHVWLELLEQPRSRHLVKLVLYSLPRFVACLLVLVSPRLPSLTRSNLSRLLSSSPGNSLQICGGFYTTNAYRYTLSLSSSSVQPSSTRISSRISSSSSTASSTSPSPTYVYQGCAQDYPYDPMAGRTLTGSYTQDAKMTNQMCWSICAKGGFKLAGTQSTNECWCGNFLDNGNGATATESDCGQPCVGDSKQMCGGESRSLFNFTFFGMSFAIFRERPRSSKGADLF